MSNSASSKLFGFGFIFCMSLFLIVLPAIFLWFYSNKNVKATCLSRAPLVSSSPSYPIPVAIVPGHLSDADLDALS